MRRRTESLIAALLVIGALASIGLPRSSARRLGLSRLMAIVSVANVLFLVAFPPMIGLSMFFSDLLPLPEVFVPPGNPTFFYSTVLASVVAAFVALQCAFAAFLHYWNLLGYAW